MNASGKKELLAIKVHEDVLLDILGFSEDKLDFTVESNVFTNHWWKWEYWILAHLNTAPSEVVILFEELARETVKKRND